jgi:hypothetical protein
MKNQRRLILSTAVLTCLCLGSTLSFPFWYGLVLYYAPVELRQRLASYLSPDTTPDIWLPSMAIGGLIWGSAVARLRGLQPLWRLGFAGGLGVLLGGIVAVSTPFPHIFGVLWPQAPVHVRWIMNLVLSVALGGGIAALILGLAIHWRLSALSLALGVALAAALSALLVALGLDAMGIRWGMGNANMAKIAGLAFPVATFSAGLLIGSYLTRYQN